MSGPEFDLFGEPLPFWQFDGLNEDGGYGVIMADPAWYYRAYSKKGEKKNPSAHYPCMKPEELAALRVRELAGPDCALIMWVTAPMLQQALALMAGWGFAFKTAGVWAKQSPTGKAWAFGTGYIFRSAAEFYIVGTIGRPKVNSRSVRNLIVAPRREHSRKPEQLYVDVEKIYGGPYAELFARTRRPGWDAWGNDVEKFDTA